jgi:acyl-CoA reductase-like NAD-dependent aldehyde dehydrogenase
MDDAGHDRAITLKAADRLFIGGAWVPPADGHRLRIVNPATDEVVMEVAEARAADMARAVAAARAAFDGGPWPRLSPRDRGAYLNRLAGALRARSVELGHAWTQQVGVTYGMARHAGARGADIFESYARMAETFPWIEEHKPADGRGVGFLVREPVGVCALITPWNAPLSAMANKVAPALLSGSSVIMKPAPETPLEAYIIAECAEAAGFPPGVVNLVPAGREAADALVQQQGVDKVSFTGGTNSGKRVAAVCAERVARFTLELGGKSAAIVLDDYDPAMAAAALAPALCLISGQVCAALTRILVPRRQQAAFAEAFAARLKAVRIGDPYDEATQMGPLAMRRQRERVEGYVAQGVAEGARLVAGGRRPPHLDRGEFLEPALFADVDNGMTIAREEIFGPVASLIPYDNDADAIRLANDSVYGLNGAIFTPDVDRAYRIARSLRTGTVGHNAFRVDFSIAFGGFKQSGIGREGGREGLLPYLEAKTLLLDSRPVEI